MSDQDDANLVEVKTSELIGPALDYAVALAIGETGPEIGRDGIVYCKRPLPVGPEGWFMHAFSPSTDWGRGGPLLDRFDIALNGGHDGNADCIFATLRAVPVTAPYRTGCGPTRLIAAMRSIVAAKLGDTVKVPAELMP
jgi:hypothetical protein